MLQAGGIDKLVEQKADAYRSNPQALQKRYSQNQELMDLLAMQKLKTEKEAAARDMQLKAEQTPSTIAEQYEQQLVGMNKNEMAQQTAGIMGERQKKAQQKQQAIGIPPQQAQQRPPMPQAASQGIASQPRPNMQGMAKGGIIGYEKGGGVENSRLLQALKALGMTYKEYKALGSREKGAMEKYIQEEYVKQRKEAPSFTEQMGEIPIVKAYKERVAGSRKKEAEEAQAAEEEVADRLGIKPQVAPSGVAASGATASGAAASGYSSDIMEKFAKPKPPASGDVPDGYSSGIMEKFAKPKTPTVQAPDGQAPDGQAPTGQAPNTGSLGGLSTAQQLQDVLNTPKADLTGLKKTGLSDQLGSSFMDKIEGRIDVDPQAKSDAARAKAASDDPEKGGFGVKKYQEGLGEYLKQKKALDAKALDPEAAAKRKRDAYLLGVRKGGGLGGAEAMANFDRNLAKSAQVSNEQQRDLYVKNETEKNKVVKDINAEAAKTFEVYTNDVAAAMNTLANVTKADLELYQKDAEMLIQANQFGIKTKVDAIRVNNESKLQELVQRQADFQDISRAIEGLVNSNTELREQYEKALQPEMLRLNNIMLSKTATKGERLLAEKQLKDIEGTFQAIVDKTKTDELIAIYKDLMLDLKANGGYSSQITTKFMQKINNLSSTSNTSQSGSATNSTQANAQKAQGYLQQAGQSGP